MEVLKDIKMLGKKDGRRLPDGTRGWPQTKFDRICEMNMIREERKEFREERLREGSNFDLESLFGEETSSKWATLAFGN